MTLNYFNLRLLLVNMCLLRQYAILDSSTVSRGIIKTSQQHWHYQWRDFVVGLTFCMTNGRASKDSVRWLCQCMCSYSS